MAEVIGHFGIEGPLDEGSLVSCLRRASSPKDLQASRSPPRGHRSGRLEAVMLSLCVCVWGGGDNYRQLTVYTKYFTPPPRSQFFNGPVLWKGYSSLQFQNMPLIFYFAMGIL